MIKIKIMGLFVDKIQESKETSGELIKFENWALFLQAEQEFQLMDYFLKQFKLQFELPKTRPIRTRSGTLPWSWRSRRSRKL